MKFKRIIEEIENESNPKSKGFSDESPKLSIKEKSTLLEKVKRYNEYGKKIKVEDSLVEVADSLSEIAKLAEIYACDKQSNEWFSNEVVKEDFKRARNVSESFKKIARECYGKLQKLNALYDDFGHILERYYEIADIPEVNPDTANMKSQRGLPNADPTAVVEVKPNTSNVKSQRGLPSMKATPVEENTSVEGSNEIYVYGPGSATSWSAGWSYLGKADSIKAALEKWPNATFMKTNPGEYNDKTVWTRKSGEITEVNPNDADIKSQRTLPTHGPATPQIKEVAPEGWEKTVKAMKKHPNIDNPWALAYWMKNKGYKAKKEGCLNEVNPNTSNLKSQRELPQGKTGSCGCLPKPENPSVKTNPAGTGTARRAGADRPSRKPQYL